MTIAEARTSCKALLRCGKAKIERIPRDVLLVAILLLASSASFGLGVLAGQGMAQGGDITISQIPESEGEVPLNLPASIPAGGQVVASKNGTKYYPEGCSGALRISSANIVTFASSELAEAAGYSLAASCK